MSCSRTMTDQCLQCVIQQVIIKIITKQPLNLKWTPPIDLHGQIRQAVLDKSRQEGPRALDRPSESWHMSR